MAQWSSGTMLALGHAESALYFASGPGFEPQLGPFFAPPQFTHLTYLVAIGASQALHLKTWSLLCWASIRSHAWCTDRPARIFVFSVTLTTSDLLEHGVVVHLIYQWVESRSW